MNHKIVILYSDAKREYFSTEQLFISEVEVKERAGVIAKYLEKLNYKVNILPGNETIFNNISAEKPDLIFNLVDSVRGQEYLASSIPGVLELADLPYTGAGQLGIAISSNKFLTNKLLEQAGVTVPKYQLFKSHTEPILPQLQFPLITKLNSVHGSIEMGISAIVENERELRDRLKYLIHTYSDEVLVSEYIGGKEITAILLEGLNKKVYLAQKIFEGKWKKEKYKVASFDAVWGEGDSYHYKKIEEWNGIKDAVKKAYDVLKMDDYAKFDIRVDDLGRYYFIDANPNPALGPKEADCAIGTILNLYDINFNEILHRIIKNSLQRSE